MYAIRSYYAEQIYVLQVEDDGVGIDTSKITLKPGMKGGFGLFSIAERLESINGTFNIGPSDKGTIAEIILPLYKLDIIKEKINSETEDYEN